MTPQKCSQRSKRGKKHLKQQKNIFGHAANVRQKSREFWLLSLVVWFAANPGIRGR